MSLTARRILFYLLTFIFLLLGLGLTLYAKGIRLSFNNFKLTTIGGMYIIPSPGDAMMALDGKPLKANSGIFQKGTLVTGLFPQTHILELSADGYRPWKRTVLVEPSKVADIQSAVLVPSQPVTALGRDVRNVWLVNGDTVLQEGTSTLILGATLFPLPGRVIDQAGNEFLTSAAGPGGIGSVYMVVHAAEATSTPLRPLLVRVGKDGTATSTIVRLDDANSNQFFVFHPHSLTLGNFRNGALTPLATAATSSALSEFAATQSKIAWSMFNAASATSQLFLYDRSSQRTELIDTIPGKTQLMRWGDDKKIGIVQTNGDLYIYDADTNRISRRTGTVRDIFFTSDGNRLAVLETGSIEIFSFETPSDYARFNLRDTDPANTVAELAWYRNNHIIFLRYPNKILFLDITDIHQENVIQVASTTLSVYDGSTNKFYFLNENGQAAVLQFPKN